MGADGHIAYLRKLKVDKILEEVRAKYPDQEVDFRGYAPGYKVNNEEVYLVYWGDNATWSYWGINGSQVNGFDDTKAQEEFSQRISEDDVIVVADQEVWT